MSETISEMVLRVAPEFSSVAPETIDLFIDDAMQDVPSSARLGKKYNRAVAYYTAHLMAVQNMGSTGQVASEKVGDLQVNYQKSPSSESSITSYFEQYKRIVNTAYRMTPFVLGHSV